MLSAIIPKSIALLNYAILCLIRQKSFLTCAWICSSLGMCKKCGDLKLIACSNCKGSGSLKQGGAFSFGPLDEVSLVGKPKMTSLACNKCRSRGNFPCPECSKVPTTWLFLVFIYYLESFTRKHKYSSKYSPNYCNVLYVYLKI